MPHILADPGISAALHLQHALREGGGEGWLGMWVGEVSRANLKVAPMSSIPPLFSLAN